MNLEMIFSVVLRFLAQSVITEYFLPIVFPTPPHSLPESKSEEFPPLFRVRTASICFCVARLPLLVCLANKIAGADAPGTCRKAAVAELTDKGKKALGPALEALTKISLVSSPAKSSFNVSYKSYYLLCSRTPGLPWMIFLRC